MREVLLFLLIVTALSQSHDVFAQDSSKLSTEEIDLLRNNQPRTVNDDYAAIYKILDEYGLPIFDLRRNIAIGITNPGELIKVDKVHTSETHVYIFLRQNNLSSDKKSEYYSADSVIKITNKEFEEKFKLQEADSNGVYSNAYVQPLRPIVIRKSLKMVNSDCSGEPNPFGEYNCGWPEPDKDSKLKIVGSQYVRSLYPDDDDLSDADLAVRPNLSNDLYYRVQFEYESDKVGRRSGVGWVKADDVELGEIPQEKINAYISKKYKDAPSKVAEEIKKAADCPPDVAPVIKDLAPILNVTQPDSTKIVPTPIEYQVFATNYYSILSSCIRQTQINQKSIQSIKLTDGVSDIHERFDAVWNGLPSIKTGQLGSKTITQEQMFAITSMARTLLGEFRGTVYQHTNGENYVRVAAKIILNRANYIDKRASRFNERKKAGWDNLTVKSHFNAFVKADMDYASSDIQIHDLATMAQATDYQFSVWNDDPQEKNNHEAMLCPTNPQKPDDVEAWNKILPIAAEAILNPEFMKDSNLDEIYNYTSDMGDKWNCKTQVTKVQMGGFIFEPKPKEMRLWKECS